MIVALFTGLVVGLAIIIAERRMADRRAKREFAVRQQEVVNEAARILPKEFPYDSTSLLPHPGPLKRLQRAVNDLPIEFAGDWVVGYFSLREILRHWQDCKNLAGIVERRLQHWSKARYSLGPLAATGGSNQRLGSLRQYINAAYALRAPWHQVTKMTAAEFSASLESYLNSDQALWESVRDLFRARNLMEARVAGFHAAVRSYEEAVSAPPKQDARGKLPSRNDYARRVARARWDATLIEARVFASARFDGEFVPREPQPEAK